MIFFIFGILFQHCKYVTYVFATDFFFSVRLVYPQPVNTDHHDITEIFFYTDDPTYHNLVEAFLTSWEKIFSAGKIRKMF